MSEQSTEICQRCLVNPVFPQGHSDQLCGKSNDLDNFFTSLLHKNRPAAEQWLKDKASKLGGNLKF